MEQVTGSKRGDIEMSLYCCSYLHVESWLLTHGGREELTFQRDQGSGIEQGLRFIPHQDTKGMISVPLFKL